MLIATACSPTATVGPHRSTDLTIGFGYAATQSPQFGMRSAARGLALEGLAAFNRDGRPRPELAESWSEAPDGLSWRIHLRPSVRFHDGTLLDVATVVDSLRQQIPVQMGPAA